MRMRTPHTYKITAVSVAALTVYIEMWQTDITIYCELNKSGIFFFALKYYLNNIQHMIINS